MFVNKVRKILIELNPLCPGRPSRTRCPHIPVDQRTRSDRNMPRHASSRLSLAEVMFLLPGGISSDRERTARRLSRAGRHTYNGPQDTPRFRDAQCQRYGLDSHILACFILFRSINTCPTCSIPSPRDFQYYFALQLTMGISSKKLQSMRSYYKKPVCSKDLVPFSRNTERHPTSSFECTGKWSRISDAQPHY